MGQRHNVDLISHSMMEGGVEKAAAEQQHRRGVAVPFLHDLANKHSQDSCKGCLGDVHWPDAYFLICLRHIELRSICAMGNVMPDVVLIWEGHYVLHRVVVLFTQVEHHMKLPILLGNEKHGHSLSGCGWDPPCGGVSQNFLQEFCSIVLRALRQAIMYVLVWVHEINLLVHFPEWGKF
jgi:hypothetical protein